MSTKVNFKNKTCVVYNAVDLDKFYTPKEPRAFLREKLSINSDDIVIGQVGSLTHRKGIDILFKAFAELNREHGKLKLVLVGEGEESYRMYLQKLAVELDIAERVIFAGETASPELFYAEVFDINVLSSRVEAFGRTLIEAAACGLPSVASISDGIPEVVENGVTGLLFEKENFADLKEKLAILIEDEGLRKALGEKGRERVESRFNVKSYVDSLQDEILNTAMPTKRAPSA